MPKLILRIRGSSAKYLNSVENDDDVNKMMSYDNIGPTISSANKCDFSSSLC